MAPVDAIAHGRGLVVERFDYATVGRSWAVLRLLAQVPEQLGAPAGAALLIRRGAGFDDLLYPARACALQRRITYLPAARFGRREAEIDSQLLWRAFFAVPLEVVEFQRAVFKLTAGGKVAVALPTPGVRCPARRPLSLAAPGGAPGDQRRRISVSGARHRLAALATAAVVVATTTATPVAALAAAPGQQTTTTATTSTTTTTETTTAETTPTQTTQTTPPSTGTSTTPAPPVTTTTPPPTSPPAPTTPSPSAPTTTGASTPSPASHLRALSPLVAAKSSRRQDKRARGLTHPSVTHIFTAPGTASTNADTPSTVACTVTVRPNTRTAAARKRLKHPVGRPLARIHCTTGGKGKHGHTKRTKSTTAHGGGPGSPLRGTQPEKRSASAGGARSDGGAAVTPLGGISAEPPTPLAGSVPTLSASPQGFNGPSSWTGTVTTDPSLSGTLGNLSQLLANGDHPPQFLIPIYMEAGRRYHIPWPVLASINAIESDYGRDLSISSAGAIGWMQFMPSTWKQYELAADGHSIPNPYDPRDAIFSAARYLAAAGGAQDIERAVFAYNHATWYVDNVMARARVIAARAQYQRATVRRGTVSVFFATAQRRRPVVRFRGGLLSHYDRLIAAANMVSAANFPYLYGGGHEQPARFGPFDCSGSVSYVMQQAGYKVPTTVSGDIPVWKLPAGPGRVTIFYNPVHTFMRIGNRFFGTSGFARGPGGGAGWFDVNRLPIGYLDSFREVHVPKLGSNSFAPPHVGQANS